MKLRLVMAVAVVAAIGTFTLSAQAVTSQWDGVYTVEQAKRGEQLYDKKCSSCHGTDLNGGLHAPALVGSGFTPNWNNVSLYDLFERMRTSMPEDEPGSLSRRQTADIVAFMLQKGEYPAGTSELPTEAEILQTYKFFALRPSAK
jgi:mono/diheme cytochrome c family protein